MIYFVEDDKSIRELVVYTLRGSGYEAEGFSDSESFFETLDPALAELVLLDIMLPGESGLSVLRRLREEQSTRELPVIMVTALGSEYDKVVGLDSGADDYIPKPFGMMELMARVRAQLRRRSEKQGDALVSGGITLYPERRAVIVEGAEVVLTFKEFELLHFLILNRGKVMSRERILDAVWGFDFEGESRTVDVHIRTLRYKLGSGGDQISTVRGVGYRIDT